MVNLVIIAGFVAVFNLMMYGFSSLLLPEGELFASQHGTISIVQASALPLTRLLKEKEKSPTWYIVYWRV